MLIKTYGIKKDRTEDKVKGRCYRYRRVKFLQRKKLMKYVLRQISFWIMCLYSMD